MTEKSKDKPENGEKPVKKDLSPEALRALAEVEERRKKQAAKTGPKELGGRGGEDPARYGDWEVKGRAIDF